MLCHRRPIKLELPRARSRVGVSRLLFTAKTCAGNSCHKRRVRRYLLTSSDLLLARMHAGFWGEVTVKIFDLEHLPVFAQCLGGYLAGFRDSVPEEEGGCPEIVLSFSSRPEQLHVTGSHTGPSH